MSLLDWQNKSWCSWETESSHSKVVLPAEDKHFIWISLLEFKKTKLITNKTIETFFKEQLQYVFAKLPHHTNKKLNCGYTILFIYFFIYFQIGQNECATVQSWES